jgi:AraC-like DNA-binding protein
MNRKMRRKVDWRVTAGEDPPRARLRSPSPHASGLAHITSALLANPSGATVDRALRDAVELARGEIGHERVAIFLLDPSGQTMVGTWGTSADGTTTTDEHDIMFDVDDMVRALFARTSQGFAWSVYENCPYMAHHNGRSRVLGRGWLACTTIQGGGRPIGILFNDTAISRAPVDETKQARTAVLCALLGNALERCRASIFERDGHDDTPRPLLIRQASELLARDPSIDFQALATRLRVGTGHLTRTFKRATGSSIVSYRNEVRLALFLSLVNVKPMLEAALGAGFGSYAQFHRVFRARFGKGPREYLHERSREQGPRAS